MSRSINFAVIIGNLTRDPEMRYTPQGHAVASFSVATNRSWVSDGGKKEDVEFHRVVAWDKLAEICSQLLQKGSRVYVQGRLQTRDWEGKDGVSRKTTEIVADEMVVLGRRKEGAFDDEYVDDENVEEVQVEEESEAEEEKVEEEEKPKAKTSSKKASNAKSSSEKQESQTEEENVESEEIPF